MVPAIAPDSAGGLLPVQALVVGEEAHAGAGRDPDLAGAVAIDGVDHGRRGRSPPPLFVEEVAPEPVEDLRQPDRTLRGVDPAVALAGDELPHGGVEVGGEGLPCEGAPPKTRAADRGAVERGVDARVAVALAHDLVFELLEAQAPAAERAAGCGEEADAEQAVAPDGGRRDAAVEDAGDDQCVVGVEPVGELVVAGREEVGRGIRARESELREIAVELAAVAGQPGVVDEPRVVDEALENGRPPGMSEGVGGSGRRAGAAGADGADGSAGAAGSERERQPERGGGDRRLPFQASAPEQLEPAPAVQPKQWPAVAMALPARSSSRAISQIVRRAGASSAGTGNPSIRLKSQS